MTVNSTGQHSLNTGDRSRRREGKCNHSPHCGTIGNGPRNIPALTGNTGQHSLNTGDRSRRREGKHNHSPHCGTISNGPRSIPALTGNM
jgi:hypothetical protein